MNLVSLPTYANFIYFVVSFLFDGGVVFACY